MGQVIWAPSAIADIEAIAEYIARDSVDSASLVVAKVIEATGRLERFPQSGRVIPEIGSPDCREIVVGNYRVMYRLESGDVWITGAIHGATDWQPGF
jgi:plasmid stabilization system protein ParE